jgi:hypothetical protein
MTLMERSAVGGGGDRDRLVVRQRCGDFLIDEAYSKAA